MMAELIRWSPLVAFWWFMALVGTPPLWAGVLVTVLLPLRILVDYRPYGRGARALHANRTDPGRGFEWATTDSADPDLPITP
jgi:hypothetical protein